MRHILVVDDEEDITYWTQQYLEQLGYRVTVANDGHEAFMLSKQEAIDAVITDYRMPKMNGRELLEKVRVRHPDIPVIIVSGYVHEIGVTEDIKTQLMYKPCGLAVLHSKLNGMLGS